jgi:uncharacterized protein
MIFVDSNIPMYLVGAPHPHKDDARRLLELFVAERTSFAVLLALVDEVYPIQLSDAERRDLVLSKRKLSARDAIHVAVMERNGIKRILSFDAGFGRHIRSGPCYGIICRRLHSDDWSKREPAHVELLPFRVCSRNAVEGQSEAMSYRANGRSIDMAISSAIKTERPSAASSEPRRRTAWRLRQVPKLFPYGRRYGRDLR